MQAFYTSEVNTAKMQKKSLLYLFLFFISFSLLGCGKSNENSTQESIAASVSETLTEFTADTVNPENKAETATSSTFVNSAKGQIIIPDLPNSFVECTKYIGKDISELGIDTEQWNFDAYTQDVGKSSLYGNTGTVSIQLGWDDATITNVTLRLDDGEYIQGENYTNISNEVEKLFGEPVPISDGITNYQGKTEYSFRLLRNGAGIAWNTENQEEFDKSNPQNSDSDIQTAITEEAKRSPEIGMTADEVKNSTWGEPSDINKTTTKYGVREQWVYRSSSKTKYIYFEDGIVTTIQE